MRVEVVALREMASLGAMTDLMDLVYLGLSAKTNNKLFTIVHEGKRYVYENEAAWKTDVDKLKGEKAAPVEGGDGDDGGGKRFERETGDPTTRTPGGAA